MILNDRQITLKYINYVIYRFSFSSDSFVIAKSCVYTGDLTFEREITILERSIKSMDDVLFP